MENVEKWVPAFGLVLVALILSIASIYMPWWSIKTTREVELDYSATANVEYNLLLTVSASLKDQNTSQSIVVPLENLISIEADKQAIISAFNTTFNLLIGGVILTVLSLALILLLGFGKPTSTLATATGIVATAVLLVAPIYLTFSLPPVVAKFSTPILTPSTWPLLQVEEFWGSIKMSGSSDAPFWIWGAATGWYIAFVASFLPLIASISIRFEHAHQVKKLEKTEGASM